MRQSSAGWVPRTWCLRARAIATRPLGLRMANLSQGTRRILSVVAYNSWCYPDLRATSRFLFCRAFRDSRASLLPEFLRMENGSRIALGNRVAGKLIFHRSQAAPARGKFRRTEVMTLIGGATLRNS